MHARGFVVVYSNCNLSILKVLNHSWNRLLGPLLKYLCFGWTGPGGIFGKLSRLGILLLVVLVVVWSSLSVVAPPPLPHLPAHHPLCSFSSLFHQQMKKSAVRGPPPRTALHSSTLWMRRRHVNPPPARPPPRCPPPVAPAAAWLVMMRLVLPRRSARPPQLQFVEGFKLSARGIPSTWLPRGQL